MGIVETVKAGEVERATELSPAKREQILRGARAVFGALGYERASVDAIAARAGVSKATVYNHFHDGKKALFLAAFSSEIEDVRAAFLSQLEQPTGDLEADLRKIGEGLLRLVSSPGSIRRHRVVCGAAESFPEVGAAFFECTVKLGRERMARFLEVADRNGLVRISDPAIAALDFSSLCLGDLVLKLQVGAIEKATDEEIRANVERAVATFLRAYPRC